MPEICLNTGEKVRQIAGLERLFISGKPLYTAREDGLETGPQAGHVHEIYRHQLRQA